MSGQRELPRPAYFLLPPLQPERARPPSRDGGLRGRLGITLTAQTELHIGSGSPILVGGRLVPGIALGRAGRQVVPIIPGSSLKGAVRAIVEAVTPSCERVAITEVDACRRSDALCPACRIFGAPGWKALIGFGDLAVQDSRGIRTTSIPQRYSHRNAPRRGRRLYGPEPEDPLPDDDEQLVVVTPGTRFRGALFLDGIDRVGLGLVLLALGVTENGLPHLRIGGGKNRGLGIAEVTVDSARVYASLADWLLDRRLTSGEIQNLLEEAVSDALKAHPRTSERFAKIRSGYTTSGGKP